jgi:hypothetical protein
MDIYSILEKLAVISNKQTLTEGQMKRSLEARAEKMSKADFVANAGEYGMSDEEAAEFWAAVNGEEEVDEAYEKLPQDQLGLDKFSQAALSGGQRKRDALANPNQTRMLAKKSAQQQPVRETDEAFAKGDRVMYNNTFATVAGQDGDSYIVKVDGQPNTMKVPASAIKKPSYNEGAAEGDDSVLLLLKKFISMKSDPADRQDLIKVYRAFQQGMPQGFETLSDQWGTNLDAEFYHFAKQQGVDLNSIAKKHGALKDSMAESKKSKPDFLDMDRDGDKKEPMKKAVADKKKGAVKESEQNMSRAAKGYEKYGKQGMQALAKAGKDGKSLDPIRKKYDKYDESAKPDFLDLDQDGNKKEPMKSAAKDKNDAKGSFQKQMGGSAKDLTKGLSIGAKKVNEAGKNPFPGTPEYELRFGKDDASSAFDKKKISTGTVYSRKHQEEPEADDDTPRTAGRPKGAKRRLGAKGPGVDSKLLKGKGGLKEQDIDPADRGEYDREGDMALNQIHQIADAVEELHSILDADANLPEWVQSKITKALDYIDTARDYLDAKGDQAHKMIPEKAVSRAQQQAAGAALAAKRGGGKAIGASKEMTKMSTKELEKFAATKHKGLPKKVGKVEEYDTSNRNTKIKKEPTLNLPQTAKQANTKSHSREDDRPMASDKSITRKRSYMEEPTDTRDNRAERAGKRVARDLEYDMKHKGKDDNKAEKAGKRVTKDIEYDDKKDKKKEVDETTVAGSVATSAAPAKSKGGMQFGKGVYEGAIAESFEKKLGSILNEGMNLTVSTDDQGQRNISVSATGADADSLGDMLKMAGLFSSEGYSRTCEHCHGIHEAGACQAEQVDEELANAPNEQYSDADTMINTLSGGLNGPKLQSNPNNMGDNPLAMSRLGHTSSPSLNLGDIAESVGKESTTRLWDLYKGYKAK